MLNGTFVIDNPHLSGFEKYKRGYQTHILSEKAILRVPLWIQNCTLVDNGQCTYHFHSMFYRVQGLFTVHDQSGDICIQGYLRILWIGNAKSLKIDNIYKRYVLCQNWSISLKIVKLNPWMQQLAVRCQSKNITWNRSMACRDTIGLLSL